MQELICIGGTRNRQRLKYDGPVARVPVVRQLSYAQWGQEPPNPSAELSYEYYRFETFEAREGSERFTVSFWVPENISRIEALKMIMGAY